MQFKLPKTLVTFSFYFITVLTGCTYSENEMIGKYAPLDYINTFDTIDLQANGKYHRKVYNKHQKLMFEMDGRWNMHNEVINFEPPYFFNLDRDISKFPELLQDTASNGGGWIDTKHGTIEFCVGYHQNENCYRKVK